MRLQIFIVLLCASCMLLPPVEASILTWLAERFWFLNPLNLLPWNWNTSSTTSTAAASNSITINGSGKNGGIYNSGTQISSNGGMNFMNGGINFGNGNVYTGGSWISGNYQGSGDGFPESLVPDDGPLYYSGGKIVSGRWISRNYGDVFNVRIIQHKGKNGECEEEITIVPADKTVGKMFNTKCLGSLNTRSITLQESLLLIGGPEENFCAFTTNKNEVYYLKDGKWRKGDFSGDDKKDQDLSSTDTSKVKGRITKWKQFYDALRKKKESLRGLKDPERTKRNQEKERIRRLIEQERNKYYEIRNQIRQQKNDERNRYYAERNQIYAKRNAEGWSPAIDALLNTAERKFDNKFAELERRESEEDNKYEAISDKYDKQIDAVDNRCDKEINRLDRLIDEEDNKAAILVKQYIKQGW